jgi:DNA-binding NtrC family response regulator
VVNCAGLADSLINSQLFGHKKGSFTDATSDRKGVFEAANGGTILLDEIGDIPPNTQTRILRALEQREIIRVGETEPRKVDIRILAATNKNLEEEVERGNFRLDLLYRIRIARVSLPALRERREDVPLLVEAFARQICLANGVELPRIEKDVLSALMVYRWPGNVRELRNAVEFAIINSRDGCLRLADLPPEITAVRLNAGDDSGSRDVDGERHRIKAALETCGGRKDKAAKLLGISRATLYRRLKLLALD